MSANSSRVEVGFWEVVIFAFIGVSIGMFGGRIVAHQEIAKECTKLGGFYVGDSVYQCKKVLP